MSITSLEDRLVHYEALGHGEPVLFLHGWLGSWRYWWKSMQALSVHHRTFALDFWGFGDSSKVSGQYTVDAYVNLVDQFATRLGIVKPMTIVGHALGAAVALKYAVANPQAVRAVALVSAPLEGRLVNPELAERTPDEFIHSALAKDGVFPEVAQELRKTDGQALAMTTAELIRQDLVTHLDRCDRPLLLVTGAQDTVVGNRPELPSLAAPGRQHILLENCGHFPMLEDPARFNRLLLDFLHAGDQEQVAPKSYWQRRTR